MGRADRFIDLGGDSVLLVKIHSCMLDELGFDVPITTLFKFATVSALAAHLNNDDTSDSRMAAARLRAIKSRNANKQRRPRKSP